jgi:sulfur carrier protein
MIEATINGKKVTLEKEITVTDYLTQLRVDPRVVAVELDGEILEKKDFDSKLIKNGSIVEIVRMVGGGLF